MANMEASEAEEFINDGDWALLQGELDEAEAAYVDAERTATVPLERARSLVGIANILIKREHFDKAREILQAAILLFGKSAPASTWSNLGFTLDKLGAFRDAVEAHRNGISVSAVALGSLHSRTLRMHSNMAYSLVGLGKLDDAEAFLEQMVEGFESQLEAEPLGYAMALSSYGYFLLRSRHKPSCAHEAFERAEALRDRCSLYSRSGSALRVGFPLDFDIVLTSNRAAALTAMGQSEKAQHLLARCDLLREHKNAPAS
jgi:tetratricopeptide (TPR) repeat protein